MNYEEYLQTEHWQHQRKKALKFWDHRCMLCFSNQSLIVHHRCYYRLWAELPTDVVVLCDQCHKRHHAVIEQDYKLQLFWDQVYTELKAEGLWQEVA